MIGTFTIQHTSGKECKPPKLNYTGYAASGSGRTSLEALKQAMALINFSFPLSHDDVTKIVYEAVTDHQVKENDERRKKDLFHYITIYYMIDDRVFDPSHIGGNQQ